MKKSTTEIEQRTRGRGSATREVTLDFGSADNPAIQKMQFADGSALLALQAANDAICLMRRKA